MSDQYDLGFHCLNKIGTCYTLKTCEDAKRIAREKGYEIGFRVRVYDHVGAVYTIDVDGDDMWVSGYEIGLTTNPDDALCAYKIFANKELDQEHWFVGNQFLRQQYISFDMSPYAEGKEKYLNIGIGLKNPNFQPDYSKQTITDSIAPYNPERNETTGGDGGDTPHVNPTPVNPDGGDGGTVPTGEPGTGTSSGTGKPGQPGEPGDEGGSGGLIAFFLFVIAIAAGGGYYYYKKKKLQQEPSEPAEPTEIEEEEVTPLDNAAVSLNREMETSIEEDKE